MAEDESSLISTASKLFGLYLVYVFLSGWAFNDHYFRFFGVDPRFLDLSFYDTLVRGFTVLFSGPKWLWALYMVLLLGPLCTDLALKKKPYVAALLLVPILLLGLVVIYKVSRDAGKRKARIDKSEKSTLPAITFTVRKQEYAGKLLYARAGVYFVDSVRPLGRDAPGTLELFVFRAEELSDVRLTEHE